jgi:pimeloyl-ACP methyl ester carboxylesterase
MRADRTHCASLRLADGRRLSYSATGAVGGAPVLYCHGAIGTPLSASVDLEAITNELGIRYIAVSRPGVGASDPAPDRAVLDFARDVHELVDGLGVERFAVVGVSAGGPYALAIARELPDRVERVAVCSSLSPLCAPHRVPGMDRRIRMALACVARAPRTWATLGDAVLPVVRRHPRLITRVIAAHAARCERERLLEPAEQAAASSSFLEAAAGGVGGIIEDYLVSCHDWGFSPGDVETEVHLWHGVRDPLVPIEHALQLAITLPRCRMFFDADEGHHFFRARLAKILTVLIGRDADPGDGVATSLDHARRLAGGRAEGRRRRVRG